jgi:hypothetical protein
MAESEYRVKISTPTDTSGAKETADALAKIAPAGEEAAKQTDKLELSHRQLHIVLERIAPALAGITRFLSFDFAGAVGAALIATELLQKHFKLLLAITLEEVEAMRRFDNSQIEAAAESARKIADGMQDYLTAQDNAIRGEAALAAASAAAGSQRLAELDAQIDGLQKVQEAEEKEAEAEVDNLVQTGKITEQEGERRKHILQEQLAGAAANAAAQKEAAKIEEQRRALAEAQARLPGEQAALAAANIAAAGPVQGKTLQDNLAALNDKIKKADEALANSVASTEAFAAGQTMGAILYQNLFGAAGFAQQAKDYAAEDAAKARFLELLKARAKYLDDMIHNDQRAAEAAKKHADALEKQIEDDKKLLETGPAKIESEERIAALHAAAAQAALNAGGRAHQIQEWTKGVPRTPQDIASQNAWANMPAEDLNYADIRGQFNAARAGYYNDTQLHALLNEFLGLAHDLHLNKVDRNQFDAMARDVENLRGEIQNMK